MSEITCQTQRKMSIQPEKDKARSSCFYAVHSPSGSTTVIIAGSFYVLKCITEVRQYNGHTVHP